MKNPVELQAETIPKDYITVVINISYCRCKLCSCCTFDAIYKYLNISSTANSFDNNSSSVFHIVLHMLVRKRQGRHY